VANSYPDIRVETGYENGTGNGNTGNGNTGNGQQHTSTDENHVINRRSHHDSPTGRQSADRQTSSSGQLHFETGL